MPALETRDVFVPDEDRFHLQRAEARQRQLRIALADQPFDVVNEPLDLVGLARRLGVEKRARYARSPLLLIRLTCGAVEVVAAAFSGTAPALRLVVEPCDPRLYGRGEPFEFPTRAFCPPLKCWWTTSCLWWSGTRPA